ncbi:MAG: C39 family peptidase [Clostridium sp.]|uniref:C39 family peptidase n=1 Tax=Clostridium sp. TaxID=1506 RepID=UPI003036917B
MKNFFRLLMIAFYVCIVVVSFKVYLNEREKVSALQDHMSFLASKGDISYISSEEEKKLKKEEAKRVKEAEDAAKKEAERIAAEEKAAKKEEEKKLKLEELERMKAQLEKEKKSSKTLILDIPIISQLPEYKNGCEATSLTMMLNYAGIETDKHSVISLLKKDETPIKYDSAGNIIEWGNPKRGFVGDITGETPGYSIDPVALATVITHYLPGKALDLTGTDYSNIESTLLSGRPIVVWITSNFKEPKISHTWVSGTETVNSYFSQHAVLLTGIDDKNLYYNDPLTGVKNASVDKKTFQSVWTHMGKKALSYYK